MKFLRKDLIERNKLSNLHDGSKIIFCKTDFLLEEFKYIRSLNHDVKLITGNSDLCITDELVQRAPGNIKIWFCQNKMSNNLLLKSIPIGIENTISCARPGHGHVFDFSIEKPEIIINCPQKTPSRLVYANFNKNTNLAIRNHVEQICRNSKYITWGDPQLNYRDFVLKCLDYEMVVCPEGNGPDTHRFWEILYMGRIPIARLSIATEDFKNLPVVWVDSWEELEDESLILNKFYKIKEKNLELCYVDYWENLIRFSYNTFKS